VATVFVESDEECCQVTKQSQESGPGPGPGRSTSDAAFSAVKKDIADRNEQTQKEARKLRVVREQEQARRRRAYDLS
jgi:hypothetical protein